MSRDSRRTRTEFAPEADIVFHQELCQAGITTEALEELGGCEILPPLIESEEGCQSHYRRVFLQNNHSIALSSLKSVLF